MFKRRFYDVLAFIFILLVIIIIVIQFISLTGYYSQKELEKVQECSIYDYSSQNYLNCMQDATKGDLVKNSIFKLILYTLGGIYYIFILILAIQLHKENKLSITNIVVIALIMPLAVVFYFTTLRKPLKEFEKSE